MQLFPAIDLRGGQVVRLTQGDYDRMTIYGQDPCAQAPGKAPGRLASLARISKTFSSCNYTFF